MNYKIYDKDKKTLIQLGADQLIKYLQNFESQLSNQNYQNYEIFFTEILLNKDLSKQEINNNFIFLKNWCYWTKLKIGFSYLVPYLDNFISKNYVAETREKEVVYNLNINNLLEDKTNDKEFVKEKHFVYFLREIDFKSYQLKINSMSEKEIKTKFNKKYFLSPLFLSALNKDPKVLELTLSLYKKFNIDMKKALYATDMNNIVSNKKVSIHNEKYIFYKDCSAFDVCLAYGKVENAQLLMKEGLNKNKLSPFEMGGIFYYLATNTKNDKHYKQKVLDMVLKTYDYEKNPNNIYNFNFVNYNKNLNSDYIFKFNFDYLENKHFLDNVEKQNAFLNFIIKMLQWNQNFIQALIFNKKHNRTDFSNLSYVLLNNLNQFEDKLKLQELIDTLENKILFFKNSGAYTEFKKEFENLKSVFQILIEQRDLKLSISEQINKPSNKFKI